MNAPTRIERIPHWPQMMTRKLAADYCCLSEAQFQREIIDGRLPDPVVLGGVDHWHRPTLDRHLEMIAGAVSDWRSRSPMYAKSR
ncbi:hypothetical protein [Sphingopyxis sp. 550A]